MHPVLVDVFLELLIFIFRSRIKVPESSKLRFFGLNMLLLELVRTSKVHSVF